MVHTRWAYHAAGSTKSHEASHDLCKNFSKTSTDSSVATSEANTEQLLDKLARAEQELESKKHAVRFAAVLEQGPCVHTPPPLRARAQVFAQCSLCMC